MSLTEVLRDPHLVRFAAILKLVRHAAWRRAHPTVPVLAHFGKLERMNLHVRKMRSEFVQEFLALLNAVRAADDRLSYSDDDLMWLLAAADNEAAAMIFTVMLTMSVSPSKLISAAQVSEIAGKTDRSWRGRAEAGDFPGAEKVGSVWLFPLEALMLSGVIDIPKMLALSEQTETAD